MRPSEETSAPAPKPLCIVTDSRSVAEFIHRFCPMVDERHIVVTLERPRPRGTRLRFSVQLADGEPVFQGAGRIVAVQERGGGAGVAVTIALDELDAESRTMHRCLLIATRVAGSRPSGSPLATPRPTGMPCASTPAPRSFPRASLPLPPPPVEPATLPASEMFVPNNPLSEITSAALDQFIDSAITDPPPLRRSASMPPLLAPHPAVAAAPVSAAAPLLLPIPPPLVPAPRARPLVLAKLAKLRPRTLVGLAIAVTILLLLAYRL
jgi:hypothetical protein